MEEFFSVGINTYMDYAKKAGKCKENPAESEDWRGVGELLGVRILPQGVGDETHEAEQRKRGEDRKFFIHGCFL
jgi:hypothetical protein